MATAVDDDIASQQHQVQRLLGRCLLRLQQYEHLLKTVVAGHELSGTLHTFESNRAARIGEVDGRRSTWYRERMDVSGPTLHSIEVASA